jgi:hypothetical protein
MRWYPSQEEIQDWLTTKEDNFSQWETQGVNTNVKQWKDMYLYSNMHELFVTEFPCLLYEWLKRKTTNNISLRSQEPLVWDQVTIDRLKALDNKWTRAIDFLFSQVKEGYIIEFVVEYTDSFSEAEIKFTEGPRRRLLEEIPLWIKMLFMDKGCWIMLSLMAMVCH